MRTGNKMLASGVTLGSLVAALVSCQSVFGDFEFVRAPSFVTCHVERRECKRADANRSCLQHEAEPSKFDAIACPIPADNNDEAKTCTRQFCGDFDEHDYARSGCTATVIASSPTIKSERGICDNYPGKAAIAYTQRYAACAKIGTSGDCEVIDDAQIRSPSTAQECVDLTQVSAMAQLSPTGNAPGLAAAPKPIWAPSVLITGMVLDDPSCNATKSSTQKYSAQRRALGTVAGGGITAPITAAQTLVSVSNSCDHGASSAPPATAGASTPAPSGTTEDPPPTVCSKQLDEVKMAFDDVTIAGTTLTGVTATNVGVAKVTTTSPGHGQIAPGGLKLVLSGMVNGIRSLVAVANGSPWSVEMSDTGITLAGDIDFTASDVNSQPFSIKATVNVTAPKATPAQVACSNATYRERLFGFEDRASWRSSNAQLSLVDSTTTQGCGALAVAGQGFLTLDSERFATAALSLNSALSVDLYVPNNQPNSYWYGALHLYLTCPSGGVNNQFIGQIGLTGLPKAQFSTLRFPLPAATRSTLANNLDDCSLSMALNVNQTNENWILDNLRFTP